MLSNESDNVLVHSIHGDSDIPVDVFVDGFDGAVTARFRGAVPHATVRRWLLLLHRLDETVTPTAAAVPSGFFTRRCCTVVTR